MDSSGNVGSSDFQTMKTFVRDIANSFEIGPNDVQIGVMSYGSSNYFHFYLNTYSTKSAVLSAINAIPYSAGGTDTGGALNGVRITGFSESNGARPSSEGIPRVAIVITDGHSNSYSATVTAANALHNAGIIAFAIGIAGANQNELNAIASQSSYVSFISSFNVAQLSALQISISQEACVGRLILVFALNIHILQLQMTFLLIKLCLITLIRVKLSTSIIHFLLMIKALQSYLMFQMDLQ